MSENSTEIEVVVPEGSDAIDDLSVRELDMIARQIKCDVMQAMSGRGLEGVNRQAALARIAWVWKRRTDTAAKLDPFLDMKAGDLGTALGFDRENDDAEVVVDALPTDGASGSD